jgi:hypothetical protein
VPDKTALIRPFAKAGALAIASSAFLLQAFRSRDFKGKQLIAGLLPEALPVSNGIYECQGMTFDVDFKDRIQRDIYLGVYERHERAFLESYIEPGWTCVDIGANVGFYTLLLGKLVGRSGRVFAVEASPANFGRLNRNVSLNALPSCTLTHVAMTKSNGPVSFHTSPAHNSGWGRIGE